MWYWKPSVLELVLGPWFQGLWVGFEADATTNNRHLALVAISQDQYHSVPQIRPPSRISPLCVFSTKSCWGIFILRISPPLQKMTHTHLTVEMLFKPLGCLPLKCLPWIRTYPDQRWTRQLLRGSALLPHSSTLKLVSLPLASGASLRLTLGDAPCLAPTPHRQWLHARKGGRNHERNCRIPRISPPCVLY